MILVYPERLSQYSSSFSEATALVTAVSDINVIHITCIHMSLLVSTIHFITRCAPTTPESCHADPPIT